MSDRTIKVFSCYGGASSDYKEWHEECPFQYDSSCKHPDAPEEHRGFGELGGHRAPDKTPPAWCPLRSGSALVQLEAASGDHPGGDRADVARHDDEVTDE